MDGNSAPRRRQHIRELLHSDIVLTRAMRLEIARQYGCSLGPIYNDEYAIAAEDAGKAMPWLRYRAYQAVAQSNRRAVQYGVSGVLTIEDWQSVCKRFGYCCLKCGRSEPEIVLTIDHVQPLYRGGLNTVDNIQPLCKSCNSGKKTKTMDYR